MKCIDKLTSWVMIICILILAMMGVVSADSWTPEGELDGYVYKPYINFDYLEMYDEVGNRYILDLNDVVEALPDQQAAGYEDSLIFGFTSGSGNVYAPISIRFDNSDSTDNLICQMRIDFSNFSGGFDAPTFRFVSSDQICNTSWLNSQYMPAVRLYSNSINYPTFNMSYAASVSYLSKVTTQSNVSREFEVDTSFSGYWSSLSNSDGRTSIYRLSNILNVVNARQSDSIQYISQNGGLNTVLVTDYQVDITTNENISSMTVYLPYVRTQPSYSQYLDGFDFGSSIQTVIQTTIVTVTRPDLDFSDEYVDFSGFLVKSIGSFMNFGFWGISIGGILIFCLSWKLVRMFINFFAGG